MLVKELARCKKCVLENNLGVCDNKECGNYEIKDFQLEDFLSQQISLAIDKTLEACTLEKKSRKDIKLELGWNRYDETVREFAKDVYLIGRNQTVEELEAIKKQIKYQLLKTLTTK